MLTINVYPAHLKIEPKPPKEVEALIRAAFSYPVPGAEHIIRMHRKEHPKYLERCWRCNWNGLACLFKKECLPIGFISDLQMLLDDNNIDVQFVPLLDLPEKQYDWHHDVELRPYQQNALDMLLFQRLGTVAAATGAGKTKIAVSAICKLGVPTVVIVPRKNIFTQFMSEFTENTDIHVGEVGTGSWNDDAPVVLAMVATLTKYPQRTTELLQGRGLLVADEMHMAASKTWEKTVGECPAYFRYGFSATPYRPNDLGDAQLKGMFGDVVYEIPAAELQALGFLVPTDIRIVRCKVKPPKKVWDETIDEETGQPLGWRTAVYTKDKYRSAITLNDERNAIIAKILNWYYERGNHVACIVAWEQQYDELAPMLPDNHIYLSGSDSKKQNREKIQQFSEADSAVMVGTSVLDLGIDIPCINVLVNAGGGTFSGRTKQQIGRGLRLSEGKEMLLYFDFWDDDRHTKKKHFSKHSQSRWDTYVELGQKPVLYETAEEAVMQL